MATEFEKIKNVNKLNGITVLGVFIRISCNNQCEARLVCRDSAGVYYPTFAAYKSLTKLKDYLAKAGVQENDMMDQWEAYSLQ